MQPFPTRSCTGVLRARRPAITTWCSNVKQATVRKMSGSLTPSQLTKAKQAIEILSSLTATDDSGSRLVANESSSTVTTKSSEEGL